MRNPNFALGEMESRPEQLQLGLDWGKPAGVSFLRHGARRYAARQGLEYSSEGLDQLQADSAFQSRVAQSYERSTDNPQSHRVQRAYEALRGEVGQQYDYLTRPRTKGGLGVNVEVSPEDPYKSRDEMQADIMQNRRLRVLATASTGTGALMDPETNDRFRAVHDAFGHAAIGRSFSRHGEEAAYHSHAQMFSPAALPALAAETRMQNSTVNYGREPGVFPEQKAIAAPSWVTRSRIRR